LTKYDPWDVHKSRTSDFLDRRKSAIQIKIPQAAKDGAFGIVFIGDVHIDSVGCNIAMAEEHAKRIKSAKGVYAVLTGDVNDLSRLKSFGFHSDQPAISESLDILKSYLSKFGGKILAIHSGNHDEWARTVSGIDLMKKFVGDSIPYSSHRALLDIKSGEWKFRVFTTHQTKYGSGANPLLGPLTALKTCNDIPADVDVICVSHRHTKFAGQMSWKGRGRAFITPGTYKESDDLFDRECMNKDLGPVGAIFYPNGTVEAIFEVENIFRAFGA